MTADDPDRPEFGAAEVSEFRVFPGEAGHCALARTLVRSALEGWKTVVDDAELVVSELFGNGCRHTRSGEPGGTLGVSIRAVVTGLAWVSVTDQGPTRADRAAGRRFWPALKPAGLDTPGWRGLHLVATVADDWGHHPATDQGLTVWATFNLTLPHRSPDPHLPRQARPQ